VLVAAHWSNIAPSFHPRRPFLRLQTQRQQVAMGRQFCGSVVHSLPDSWVRTPELLRKGGDLETYNDLRPQERLPAFSGAGGARTGPRRIATMKYEPFSMPSVPPPSQRPGRTPTLESMRATVVSRRYEAEWDNMLGHQTVPFPYSFLTTRPFRLICGQELDECEFAWLGGRRSCHS